MALVNPGDKYVVEYRIGAGFISTVTMNCSIADIQERFTDTKKLSWGRISDRTGKVLYEVGSVL